MTNKPDAWSKTPRLTESELDSLARRGTTPGGLDFAVASSRCISRIDSEFRNFSRQVFLDN